MSSPQPQRSSSIVPLARDAEGNVIQLPEGAVGWRIRRQTGGRPRLHLDSRKQPMTFPLDYTVADVEDILPPGSYLLDAVDKSGETLGLTIALSIGQPRNGEPVEPGDEAAPIAVPAALPATTSDVRLVLEANVRATQLAFLHNQKTLELGLRMAETLRDTVQVLASSQADWIRSISSARGFFRNAPPLPPVETKQLAASAGEDLEANDDELAAASEAPPRHWTEQFAPLINMAAQQLVPAIGAWAARQRARPEKSDDDRPPFEARELFDLNYAYQKTQAHRARKAAEKQASSEPSAASATASTASATGAAAGTPTTATPSPDVDLMALLRALPPPLIAKLAEVRALLSPGEQAEAMEILASLDGPAIEHLLQRMETQTAHEVAAVLRSMIADWAALRAADEPPSASAPGAAEPPASTEP